ncbi:hypothetical protein DUT91_01875 [Phyllobacterium salinisoli]|uniref:Uncharacterized protein n=1 Tax=Phyllobacterium salinisoli TaxID=1899321 RepID=A0A368KAX1_9HYPH|nr:hypothetical protein DUT91_01875 [Phyllobacterium salinisoli]
MTQNLLARKTAAALVRTGIRNLEKNYRKRSDAEPGDMEEGDTFGHGRSLVVLIIDTSSGSFAGVCYRQSFYFWRDPTRQNVLPPALN